MPLSFLFTQRKGLTRIALRKYTSFGVQLAVKYFVSEVQHDALSYLEKNAQYGIKNEQEATEKYQLHVRYVFSLRLGQLPATT